MSKQYIESGALNQNMCVLINSMTAGGAEKVVATLYPEYQKAGVPVSFVCLEKNDFHVIEGVTPVYLSNQTGETEGGVMKLLSLFRFALKLKKYVKQNNIKLVQSHIYRANYVNILARLLGSKHKVQVVSHGMPSQYLTEGLAGKTNLFLIRWLYRKADQSICPSQGMINELVALGMPAEKSQLIRNPFDIEDLKEQAKQNVTRGEFEFDPKKKYIISIGRLLSVKRMEDAIWAFYELQKTMDSVELIILGDGDKWDAMQALTIQLAIGKKVHMLGDVKNPHKYLARSDLLVSASEFEGFSNVIVEALVAGVPIISTDCASGPREILNPGIQRDELIAAGCFEKAKHGVLTPVGDIQAMVKAMRLMLGDEALGKELASGGFHRAEAFNMDSIAHEYLEHSAKIMSTGP